MSCSICRKKGHNRRTCEIKQNTTKLENKITKYKSKKVTQRRILHFAGKRKTYKIGITGDPEKRRTGQDYQGYTRMILLHKTTSMDKVRKWEGEHEDLVRRHHKRNKNMENGLKKGGLKKNRFYYLYVVVQT